MNAVAGLIGENTARLVSLRVTFGEAQSVVLALPTLETRRLCEEVRMGVGLVYARVRPTRCSRCMAFGHLSRDCQGSDRSGMFWKCGKGDHFARECVAGIEEKLAFRRVLNKFRPAGDLGDHSDRGE